jgi:hypothetical protein
MPSGGLVFGYALPDAVIQYSRFCAGAKSRLPVVHPLPALRATDVPPLSLRDISPFQRGEAEYGELCRFGLAIVAYRPVVLDHFAQSLVGVQFCGGTPLLRGQGRLFTACLGDTLPLSRFWRNFSTDRYPAIPETDGRRGHNSTPALLCAISLRYEGREGQ